MILDRQATPELLDAWPERRLLGDRATEVDVEVAGRGPVHARDLDVAAQRDRPDPVLDPVARGLRERRREADVELARVHPDGARDEEVTRPRESRIKSPSPTIEMKMLT